MGRIRLPFRRRALPIISVHGAIQESKHVFIEAGLKYMQSRLELPEMAIFEMGFGTGLNAFLTAIDALEKQKKIYYTSVETMPLTPDETATLNYPSILGHENLFQQLHERPWNEDVALTNFFTIRKMQMPLANFAPSRQFDLIYYDAFAPSAQPELWTKEVFEKMYAMLNAEGVLVTYCSKGDVRRAMQAAGFEVEKLPGPAGKREIVRGTKAC